MNVKYGRKHVNLEDLDMGFDRLKILEDAFAAHTQELRYKDRVCPAIDAFPPSQKRENCLSLRKTTDFLSFSL